MKKMSQKPQRSDFMAKKIKSAHIKKVIEFDNNSQCEMYLTDKNCTFYDTFFNFMGNDCCIYIRI